MQRNGSVGERHFFVCGFNDHARLRVCFTRVTTKHVLYTYEILPETSFPDGIQLFFPVAGAGRCGGRRHFPPLVFLVFLVRG